MAKLTEVGTVEAQALQFLILTTVRLSNVLDATWGQFDLTHKIWKLAPEATKAGREHRVPLSDPAMAIIAERVSAAGRQRIFHRDGRRLRDKDVSTELIRRLGYRGTTAHGIGRSSFRDWCADQGVSREVAEISLQHRVGDATERSYWRSDILEARRALLNRWADFCVGGG
jgi:integrase